MESSSDLPISRPRSRPDWVKLGESSRRQSPVMWTELLTHCNTWSSDWSQGGGDWSSHKVVDWSSHKVVTGQVTSQDIGSDVQDLESAS